MPASSTKRRGSTSGRHRTGGSARSGAPQYRPGVHPILPTRTSDQVSRQQPAVEQPQNDPQVEQQEMLDELDSGSRIQPNALTPKDDVIDRYVEEDLGITNPDSQPQPTGPAAAGFTPTIGRPDKKGKAGESTDNSQKSDSESSSSGEKESLSSIINRKRDERLNANKEKYSPKNRKGLSKLNFVGRGRSRIKKAIIAATISAFAAGAVAIVGILPSAIESILTGATTSYSNFSTEGVIKKVFNDYFKEDVLIPKCRERTGNNPALSNKCNVGTSKKDGLFGRAREDFRANKMDQKLLDQGIQWDYDPGTDRYTVFVSKDGKAIPDFSKGIDYNNFDIFDLGKEEGSKFIDSKVRETINNESRWKKYFIRGPTLRAMRTRTGSTGCFFLCKTKDSFNNAKKWPKKAFGRFVKQHLLWPSSKLLSNIVDCLIGGGSACTSRNFRSYARGKIAEAAAKLFDEAFAQKILDEFDAALKKGVTRYVMEEAIKKLFEFFGKEVSNKAVGGPVAILLFIKFIGQMAERIQSLPKVLRLKNMMIIAAVSSTFMIMVNEARRGTMPLGDFGAMLSTFIGMGKSRIFASIFMGPDNKTALNGQPYTCNNAEDGGVGGAVSDLITPSRIQPGQLTCDSFKLDYTPNFINNPLIKGPAEAWQWAKTRCIPGPLCVSTVIDAIDKIQQFFGDAVAKLLSFVPGFNQLQDFISNKAESLMSTVLGALSPVIVTDAFSGVTSKIGPQGARVFDALAGGASSINQYITPRDELGGGVLSPIAQAELDSEIAQQQAQDIQYASRYDRFFNLDSTSGVGTSLLTQLAASTPANYNIGSLFNPMQNLTLAFNNSTGRSAYADNTSVARTVSSAFAVPVRGHTAARINSIAKGAVEIKDPDSAECKAEIPNWKKQIEDRSDSGIDGQEDPLGFGIPDGTSECLLADASLKVLTTNRTTTDDFPYGGDNSDSSSSDSSDNGEVDAPVAGDTYDTPCATGSTDASAGPVDGYRKGPNDTIERYSIRICKIEGFSSGGTEDNGYARFNSTVSANVVRMVKAAKDGGVSLSATSSFRSMAKQQELWNQSGQNPNKAARPGTSNHQMGFAFDFSSGSQSWIWMKANGEGYGYKWYGSGDPVHFSPTGR